MRWDEVEQAIIGRVKTLLANYEPVYAEHKASDASRSTTDLSIEFWILWGGNEYLSLGEDDQRTSGILQVDVYRPIISGTNAALVAMQAVSDAMRGQVIDTPSGLKVKFDREPPSPTKIGGDNKHWRYAVTCPFIADDL